jgi:dTDP-4-amino-4,6-dideoxygalactose transaminase
VQAAVLRVKLKHLDKWNTLRRKNAKVYLNELKEIKDIICPLEAAYAYHVYHIFAVRVKNRDKVMEELAKRGIRALIHYPIPLHLQEVYKALGYKRGDFPVAEKIAQEVISLPMYPHLKKAQIEFIVKTIKETLKKYL